MSCVKSASVIWHDDMLGCHPAVLRKVNAQVTQNPDSDAWLAEGQAELEAELKLREAEAKSSLASGFKVICGHLSHYFEYTVQHSVNVVWVQAASFTSLNICHSLVNTIVLHIPSPVWSAFPGSLWGHLLMTKSSSFWNSMICCMTSELRAVVASCIGSTLPSGVLCIVVGALSSVKWDDILHLNSLLLNTFYCSPYNPADLHSEVRWKIFDNLK